MGQKLVNQLEKRYPLLASLRIAGHSKSDRESLPVFLGLLLAAAESQDHRSCCFVFPDASRVASTAATLFALSKLSQEFDDLAREYAQRKFELGQRVIIWPAGCVYEYAGVLEAEGAWSRRFQLRVLGKSDRRTLPISDILRLEPTTRKSPKGQLTTPIQGDAGSDPLDTLIGEIRSWGNRSILKNQVLYLGSKSGFEEFLTSRTLCRVHSDTTPVTDAKLSDVLPWGSIGEDGSLLSSDQYQVEGEPLVAVSHSVENVAEASVSVEPFSRVVFVDGPERLIRNLQACDEIADSQKVIVLADHGSDDALSVIEERGFCIWRISPEEVSLGRGNSERTDSVHFGRVFSAARNYQKLELDDEVCRDDRIETAADNLNQAARRLDQLEGDEEMKRYLRELFRLLFSISDRCTPPGSQDKSEILQRLDELKQAVERRAIWVPAEVMTYLRNAFTAFQELISANTTNSGAGRAKGEALLKLLAEEVDSGRRLIIVTRNPQSVETTKYWLRENGIYEPVVWYQQFPENQTYDTIVVLSWLNAERFGKLIRRYAAPHVRLLSYPFERRWLRQFKSRRLHNMASGQPDRTEKSRLLGLPGDFLPFTQSRDLAESPAEKQTQASETFSVFDIESKIMRRRKGVPPAARASQDTYPAKYVGFVGETYAYLMENHEVPVVTNLIRNGDSPSSRIHERAVNRLEVGDFLLFREGSDRDVVQLFAEEMMGRNVYEERRELATVWRRALLQLGGSAEEIHRYLRSYGLRKKVATVRSWLRNRNIIGPWKLDDVRSMAAAAGRQRFSASPDDVWEAIGDIRSAHRRAGHKISDWLLAELAEKGNLVSDGEAKIDLGFGQFWIVEVEEIGNELDNYPAGRVNRLLWE